MKCWGDNTNGQLGDNSTMQRLTPVSVSGLASGVVAIAAGQSHTCAVTTRARVKCWGLNTNGQLGDNTITQRLTPGQRQWARQRRNGRRRRKRHTCALVSGGVKCWGLNTTGRSATTRKRNGSRPSMSPA